MEKQYKRNYISNFLIRFDLDDKLRRDLDE